MSAKIQQISTYEHHAYCDECEWTGEIFETHWDALEDALDHDDFVCCEELPAETRREAFQRGLDESLGVVRSGNAD